VIPWKRRAVHVALSHKEALYQVSSTFTFYLYQKQKNRKSTETRESLFAKLVTEFFNGNWFQCTFVVLLDVPWSAVSGSECRLWDDWVHRISVRLRGAWTSDQRALWKLRVLPWRTATCRRSVTTSANHQTSGSTIKRKSLYNDSVTLGNFRNLWQA